MRPNPMHKSHFPAWRPYLLLFCAWLHGGLYERLYNKLLSSETQVFALYNSLWSQFSRSDVTHEQAMVALDVNVILTPGPVYFISDSPYKY